MIQDNIKNKNYEESIQLVRNEIKNEATRLIQKKYKEFKYTDIYSLIRYSEKYIDGEKGKIVRCLYSPEYIFIDEKDELVMLLENYKKLIK